MTPILGRPTRILILVMMVLVLFSVIIASWYYGGKNKSVDPRVAGARELYEKYNKLSVQNDYTAVISLLDTIKNIYNQYPHYYNSFEVGVLENNRAAVYLTIGLSFDSIYSPFHSLGQDSLFTLGEAAVRNSIYIYENWLKEYSGKSEKEIEQYIMDPFSEGFINSTPEEINKYFRNRVEEISTAIQETPRRLSVSYTNLGIVHRHHGDYESAALCYKKALDLWPDNLSAENNLNILLGRPLKKRTFIQKMFPKPKE